MQRPPGWWFGVLGVLLLLQAGVTVFYRMGATGVRISGGGAQGGIDFQREKDQKLYAIDDTTAFIVGRGMLGVLERKLASVPFCPLCGVYATSGRLAAGLRERAGDWLYSQIDGQIVSAYHLATKAAHRGEGKPATELGIDLAKGEPIDVANVLAGKEPLSTVNEGCIVFTMAFVALLGVWLLVGIGTLFRKRPL